MAFRPTENYREVILAIYKYLSLLRLSALPAWYSKEMSGLGETRFRFAEKRRPEDYAVWIAEHMTWPVPRDRILSAPQLMEAWDESDPINGGEREVREMIDSLTIDRGRAVLMAKKEEFDRVRPGLAWKQEPIYGTGYYVERFDKEFAAKASGPPSVQKLRLMASRRHPARTIFRSCSYQDRTSSFRQISMLTKEMFQKSVFHYTMLATD